MTFYSILRHGHVIIVDKENYAPTTFWCEGKTIYCKTAILGKHVRRNDINASRFNEHIKSMIHEGFTVCICAQ